MKRLFIPIALVLVVALGSYAILAQQASPASQAGSGCMMGGGTNGGMMGGMMGNMTYPGGASCGGMMQASVAATTDGGVVVVVAGKLIKYDAAFKKVNEVDLDVDWNAVNQKMSQTMQDCPMVQVMK
jgi:hypothetical protein